ncbi:MAG: multidrug ABC transporter ATPase/permease [Parcubacteria group bacterium Gr01-1014_44]|nr:MAG: multidrug ABC transporter ATPase/permease [Parcubacteria group bacterium Gr01-1014_44]
MSISTQKLELASKVARRVLKNYKGKFTLILLLGFLGGLSGGIGIGVVIPIFSVLTGQSLGEADAITRTIEKFFDFLHLPFNLPFLAALVGTLFVFKAVVLFFARYTNGKLAAEYEAKLRDDLFTKTLEASWPYLLNQKTGVTERIFMNDVILSAKTISVITNLIILGTSLVTYAFISFNISAPITLLTLGFGAVLFFVFKPLYFKTRKAAAEAAETEKTIVHYLSESIQNAKAIKASGVEKEVGERSREHFQKLKKSRILSTIYAASVAPSFEPIGFLFIISLFVYYHNLPGFNFISFAAVVYLVQKMFSFVELSQGNIQRLGEAAPYVQSVLDQRRFALENKEVAGGALAFNFNQDIVFEDIKFSYEKRGIVLAGFNGRIKKGEMVGLIGSSGAGKTTIADLLLRLFRPDSGKIMLDGRNVEEINLDDWRKKLSYVSQDVFLLNDTIENNIKFFDNSISKKNITEAVEAANASNFIKELPDGFATVIGERGVKLSAGQRQRIALARVLARNPEILILDEATSALDNESELLIQRAIESLKGKVTVLAIAHRLSTVMNSDKLLVLDEGRIIEEGVPAELLKNKDSHFYKMYHIA